MSELEIRRAQEVLRRAVQIDEQRHHVEGLSEAELIAAAAELGVHPSSVAAALAEQRAARPRPPRRRSATLATKLLGTTEVRATRAVTVAPAEAEAALVAWLERAHHLRADGRGGGVVVAQRRTDLAATFGRAMRRAVEGEGALGGVREVRAGSARAEGSAALCLVADVSDQRTESLAMGGTAGVAMAVAVAVGTAAVGPLVLAGSPAVVVVGWAVARLRHRSNVRRVGAELERTAEASVRGQHPTSLMTGFGRTLGRRRQRR